MAFFCWQLITFTNSLDLTTCHIRSESKPFDSLIVFQKICLKILILIKSADEGKNAITPHAKSLKGSAVLVGIYESICCSSYKIMLHADNKGRDHPVHLRLLVNAFVNSIISDNCRILDFWLTSWLLLVMFIVFWLLSHVDTWVRCGT